ncbi:MAG: RpiB/LacA/LacB family sugar-phosphate isomerase [Cytophagales bacterium]|nr:RpiB/LacA/LacB family sugar-phosphate isomerase [Cytophagales bacterium]
MKIAIGGDHAGFAYKEKIKDMLAAHGIEVGDFGPGSDASVDYPDHVHPLATAVENHEYHQGIRAALCWNTELAALARQHNNANVLCLPARFISLEEAKACVETFLSARFEGGRHQNRVDKIAC